MASLLKKMGNLRGTNYTYQVMADGTIIIHLPEGDEYISLTVDNLEDLIEAADNGAEL